jgi:hypothetical protein
MKTICRLENFTVPNVSLYLFADEQQVLIQENKTIVGAPDQPDFVIMDCDTSNCVLKENVTEPDQWVGWKYTYTDEVGWELNPSWVDPNS